MYKEYATPSDVHYTGINCLCVHCGHNILKCKSECDGVLCKRRACAQLAVGRVGTDVTAALDVPTESANIQQ